MNFLTNKDNLKPLRAMIKEAKKSIDICSGWIRSETINRLFTHEVRENIKKKNIKVRFILRIGSKIDVKITDSRFFDFVFGDLSDHIELKYHPTQHTKMYIVDSKKAMLGSFNLTGGGFGDEARPGSNIETGVYIEDAKQVKEAQNIFNEVWVNDCIDINKDSLGFVLNETNHLEFFMVGIKPLEKGMFVQVKEVNSEENEYVIAQIEESIRYNYDFFSPPSLEESDDDFNKLFNSSKAKTNLVNGLAAQGESNLLNQLNINKVSIRSRVKLDKDGNIISFKTNRIAPPVSGLVSKASADILHYLYGNKLCQPAVLASNPDVTVGLDPFELLSKHSCVFGTTGSGKSYFTKNLLKDFMIDYVLKEGKKNKKLDDNGRVIIVDAHGEYSTFLNDNNIKYQDVASDKQLNSATSVLVEDADTLANICGIKIDHSEKKYIQQAIDSSNNNIEKFIEYLIKNNLIEDKYKPAISDFKEEFGDLLDDGKEIIFFQNKTFKKLYEIQLEILKQDPPKKSDGETPNKIELENMARELVIDRLKNKEKVFEEMINKIYKDFKKDYYEATKPILTLDKINAIEKAASEGIFRFEKINYLNQVKKSGVFVLNLCDIHDQEQRFQIAGDLMKAVFDHAKNKGKGKTFPTLFVVDEAHNFCPEKSSKNNLSYTMMKRIASEGRKFNVGLMVISQRPAYVSKDVIAQCSTQVIFRLINENDLKAVESSVEGISRHTLYELPRYQVGQAVFCGVAIREPVEVIIKE